MDYENTLHFCIVFFLNWAGYVLLII